MEAVIEKVNIERYPAYKDSGVKWLGEIPESWEVSKLKNHINMITGFPFKSEKYSNEGIKLARGINVKEGAFDWNETRYWPKIEKQIEEFLLKEGDILIGMDGSKVGKNYCKVKSSDLPILLLQRVARLRTNNTITSDFLYYLIANTSFLNWVAMTKTDPMVPHIAPTDINNFLITVPSIKEQNSIYLFLDRKTVQIDKAIAQKERLIKLLNERRQILIHKAVTRGLNPNVPMKHSGVEWIGVKPKHWEIKRLKYVVNSISIKMFSKDSLLNFIGMENIESWTGNYISSESETEGLANYFQSGDILFGKLRPYLAEVHLARSKGICSTEFLVYRVNDKIYNFYLHSLFLSFEFINLIDSSTYGSKMPRANPAFVENQMIPIPPKSEQIAISKYIEIITQKTATAISCKEKEIEKLKEYKTSLINSAVTGKIKVC